jgi:hypothetical protein
MSCLLCKSTNRDRLRLDCQKHSLCKVCLGKKAAKNVQRMYECPDCSETCSVSAVSAPIYVFVDHDNLLLEAKKLAAKDFEKGTTDHRVRINYRGLGDFIARQLPFPVSNEATAETRIRTVNGKVYNCRAIHINDPARFSLELTKSSVHTGKQKEVDTRICVDIMDVLTPIAPSTVVLVSGDRDILPALKKALDNGWKVEIYMWEHNTAALLKEISESSGNVNCIYKPLDAHFVDIISRNYYYTALDLDEESSVVLTVTNSKFKENERIYISHQSWWEKLEKIGKWPVQYKWLQKVPLGNDEHELNEPKLLLVFSGLGTTKTRKLIPKIPCISEDIPHERSPEMYIDFKGKLERSRSRSNSRTPSEVWSVVATRHSTPRSTPALLECCSGKNCEDGLKCSYYHNADDKKYFRTRYGKGHPYRKTRDCPQPLSHSLSEKCDFAHGPKDRWCSKCHKKGHVKTTTCIKCDHPKHTATQISHALMESKDTTSRGRAVLYN